MKKILAALDFSDVSGSVLKAATEFAKAFGSEIVVYHACEPEPSFVGYEAGPQVERDYRAQRMKDEHKKLDGIAADLRKEGFAAIPVLREGSTVATLKKEIDSLEVDLVIVGTHGHGAIYNLFFGSAPQGLLKGLHVPLLVVPAQPVEEKASDPILNKYRARMGLGYSGSKS